MPDTQRSFDPHFISYLFLYLINCLQFRFCWGREKRLNFNSQCLTREGKFRRRNYTTSRHIKSNCNYFYYYPHLVSVSVLFPVDTSLIIRRSIELHRAAYGFSLTASCRAKTEPYKAIMTRKTMIALSPNLAAAWKSEAASSVKFAYFFISARCV